MRMATATAPMYRKRAFPSGLFTYLLGNRGTAAGKRFGVAKAANLIAVKVLDDQG